MTKVINRGRLVDIFLGLWAVIVFISFWLFEVLFLLPQRTATLLSFFLFVILVYFFRKREKVKDRLIHFYQIYPRSYLTFGIFLIGVSALSVIAYSFVVIILGSPVLWADEWHNIHRTLFSENVSETVLSRYNQHPSYLLNALYAFNIYFLKCDELWFLLLNSLSLLGIGAIFFRIIRKESRESSRDLDSLILASLAGLGAFWMCASGTIFWNMGYIPVLGAIIAIYGLSIQEKLSFIKGFVIFCLGALLTSLSYGSGAAVWVLGALASLYLKQRNSVKVLYLGVGLVGVMLTLGIFALTNDTIRGSGLLVMAAAIPAYLGATFRIIFISFLNVQQLIAVSIVVGILGLATFGYLLYIRTKRGVHSPVTLFSLLLVAFSIGCGGLIVLGRLTNDLSVMVAGQYTSWSMLFWAGLLFLLISNILKIEDNAIRRRYIIGLSVGLIGFISIFNGVIMDLRLSSYNTAVRGKMDLAIRPDTKGNERLVWHPNREYPHLRKKVIEVNEYLKSRKWNMYQDSYYRLIGQPIDLKQVITDRNYRGEFEWSADSSGTYLEGYVYSESGLLRRPQGVLITLEEELIGIGHPYSNRDTHIKTEASLMNLFHLLPRPFRNFPGISNYYYAQLETALENTKFMEKMNFYGYMDGRLVPITMNGEPTSLK